MLFLNLILVIVSAAAYREAEAWLASLTVCSGEHSVHIEAQEDEDHRRYDEHGQTCHIGIVVNAFSGVVEVQSDATSLQVAKDSGRLLHGDLWEDREEDLCAGSRCWLLNRDPHQVEAEVDQRTNQARELRVLKERGEEHDLCKDSLGIENEEDED